MTRIASGTGLIRAEMGDGRTRQRFGIHPAIGEPARRHHVQVADLRDEHPALLLPSRRERYTWIGRRTIVHAGLAPSELHGGKSGNRFLTIGRYPSGRFTPQQDAVMPIRLPASIGARVALCLLTLGLVALGGSFATYVAMEAQGDRVTALTRAAEGPRLVERLRAEVYAVVMESRGLYVARDVRQATQFADGLRAQLGELEKDRKTLADLLPPEQRQAAAALDSAVDDFVRLRLELARVGVAEGAQAADKLGNNDANRATRTAFSKALDELAVSTAHAVARQTAGTIAAGRTISLILLGITGCAVVLVLALALWLLRRTVSRPLRALTAALRRMAEGELDDIDLPRAARGEVGGIADAARVFLAKLRRNRELEVAAAEERAARDRRQGAMDRHTQDFGTSISGVMATLSAAAHGMREAAMEMATAVERTREATITTASGAEQSSQNLASVVSATEQLTASMDEIGRQVAQAAGAAREAVDRAEATDATIRSLSDAASQVGEAVGLIASIAAQTNLLALNATIEAARAGDAGKGFAVVASEVKQLASQTAQATTQISAQVDAIRSATGDAVGAVRDVNVAIGRMDEVATAIAAAVEEQGTAMAEITEKVHLVAHQNREATRAMQDVSEVAETAGGASQGVLSSAEGVAHVSSTLSEEVQQFLAAMRATEADRRSFERLPGNGAAAILMVPGRPERRAGIVDMSRGGVALDCDLSLGAGTELQVMLPHAKGPLPGRVVRAGRGVLAITFRQDLASVERIAAALERFRQDREAA